MTREEERALIERIVSGETQAFELLVREHHRRILGLCLSLVRDTALAEDAAQESFLRAYNALGDFENRSSFSTWLSRIAANLCLELLRREGRRREESLDALTENFGDAAPALPREPQNAARDLENRDMAQRLLARLAPESRLAVTLCEVQGFSYEEIAEVMDCTLDSVKARLRRARLEMIAEMRRLEGRGA
jgi:RNA polymerase sigma-70 factor (ECF subfamily)